MSTQLHSNRLINETSPYLLQHAHNPVDWYPWSEEALAAARKQNKPILVSIGYSACHWCHVMERESFEDPAVAEIMNRYFINIKIDREERPDLDNIYMEAVQLISGSGGWPLNVFLTPDAKPFYGGTYFPPASAFNRRSWTDVLNIIHDAWENRREEVITQSEELTLHITRSNNLFKQITGLETDTESSANFIHSIAAGLMKLADRQYGGFGQPPKFPQFALLRFLLAYGFYYQNAEAKQHVHFTILKMIRGGIYDQVGGGLSRYSTDTEWLVPHFEKMLYDNALLLELLAEGYQESHAEEYKRVAYQIINWLDRDMKGTEGGYIAAIDADSEGVEGKYYTWPEEEFSQIAGVHAEEMKSYFGVTATGNFEHRNILSRKNNFPVEKAALADYDLFVSKLIEQRAKRVAPRKDDKVLLSWNALLVKGFLKCGFAFSDQELINKGSELFHFLREKFHSGTDSSMLMHCYKNGTARIPGFLDDYAYLIEAGLLMVQAKSNYELLDYINVLINSVIDKFEDRDSGLFFYSSVNHTDNITRKIETYDGPVPSANSTMALALNRFSILYDVTVFRDKAQNMLKTMHVMAEKYPSSFGNWCCAYLSEQLGSTEIVVTGKGSDAFRTEILTEYHPFHIIQSSEMKRNDGIFEGKIYEDSPVFYLCHRQFCYEPVRSKRELLMLMKKTVC